MVSRIRKFFYSAFVVAGLACFWAAIGPAGSSVSSADRRDAALPFEEIREALAQGLEEQTWPEELDVRGRRLQLGYSFDRDLQDYVLAQLKRYRSDYSAVVVLDNDTGQILSAAGWDGRKRKELGALPFSSTHPAASLFKIVTAASVLSQDQEDQEEVSPQTLFAFNGRSTTLYKQQLKDRQNRWTRRQTIKHAFAISNNVVFAKMALAHSGPVALFQMARRFGFNRPLGQGIPLATSYAYIPKSDYALAEAASGFNRKTLISPVHAAFLASVVANGGQAAMPSVLTSLQEVNGILRWQHRPMMEEVIDKSTAGQLAGMMNLTVSRGTARTAFRRYYRKWSDTFDLGGKTGSLTGGLPYGKRDWFVLYARPKKAEGNGISIAVMNVNLERWRVRSPVLAGRVMNYYLSRDKKQ